MFHDDLRAPFCSRRAFAISRNSFPRRNLVAGTIRLNQSSLKVTLSVFFSIELLFLPSSHVSPSFYPECPDLFRDEIVQVLAPWAIQGYSRHRESLSASRVKRFERNTPPRCIVRHRYALGAGKWNLTDEYTGRNGIWNGIRESRRIERRTEERRIEREKEKNGERKREEEKVRDRTRSIGDERQLIGNWRY